MQVLAARLASPQRAVESGAVELAALDQQLAKGCMQINLHYHGSAFDTVAEVLDSPR